MSDARKSEALCRTIRLEICGAALACAFPEVLHANPSPAPEDQGRKALQSVSVERFLRQIYAHFARQVDGREAPFSPILLTPGPWQQSSNHFTPDTLAIIDAHRALLTEMGIVDGDFFCGCQDWTDIEVDAVWTTPVSSTRANATVIFHDIDEKRKTVEYRLVLAEDGWRVDDMTLLGTSPDGWLVAVLKAETAELRPRSARDPD